MGIFSPSPREKPMICAKQSLCQDTPVGTLGTEKKDTYAE
jgi:hypothetical protein